MIKFFRNIRQHLLSENTFSTYLLYAIGEIILVVIGILIALQINNWNEGRKVEAFESLKAQGVNIISDKVLQKKIVDVYDSRYRFFAVSENDCLENFWLGLQHIYPTRFECVP